MTTTQCRRDQHTRCRGYFSGPFCAPHPLCMCSCHRKKPEAAPDERLRNSTGRVLPFKQRDAGPIPAGGTKP